MKSDSLISTVFYNLTLYTKNKAPYQYSIFFQDKMTNFFKNKNIFYYYKISNIYIKMTLFNILK